MILIVWVPLAARHAASAPDAESSRSSDRAYSLFSVLAPPTRARRTTPSPAPFTAKLESAYVSSAGCLTSADSPDVPPRESTGRLSRHRRRSRTSPGTRTDVGLVVDDVVDDVAGAVRRGTKAGVGFEDVPNPLASRALTFAVYATPFASPRTMIGLVVPSAWNSVSRPSRKMLTR